MAETGVESDEVRLYKCGHCGVTSASIDDLKMHMVTAHLAEAAPSTVVTYTDVVEVPDNSSDMPGLVNEVSSDQQQIEVAIPIDESQGRRFI